MPPTKKRYPLALRISFVVLLLCCIPLFMFVEDLNSASVHNAYAQTLPLAASASTSPVSVTITSPAYGTQYNPGAVIVVTVAASSTAGAITQVQLTDLLAPGPVGSPTPTTTPTPGTITSTTSSTTIGAMSGTTTRATSGPIASYDTLAMPLTTPTPFPTPPCNDPLTTPCVRTTLPYTFTLLNVGTGRHVFTAKAFDSGGNSAISSSLYIPVAGSPMVSILTPSANAVFTAPAQIVLTASAFEFLGTVTKVEYYSEGTSVSTLIGSSTTAPYTVTWSNVPAGTYSLIAFAYGSGGGFGVSSVVTTTVKPQGTTSCKVQYQVVSQWPGGFSANATITNTGTTTINGWNLQFAFGGDQKITNLWNGQYTQSGQQVTVTNLSYNGTIAPQGSTSFGFNGTWNGSNASPTSFTLNGAPCTVA